MSYGEGDLQAHIAESWRILEDAELAGHQNRFPRYGSVGARSAKRLTYRQEWQSYLEHGEYHFVLCDQSLVQFKFDLTNARSTLSYCYYENPLDVLSYDEFLREMYSASDDAGDSYRDLYEEYTASSATVKDHVTPIRYDYGPALYVSGSHPASHIHIGYQNTIRLATIRVLRPTSFLLFVMRQMYPDAWRSFLKQERTPTRCRQVATELAEVGKEFFLPLDGYEMRLL